MTRTVPVDLTCPGCHAVLALDERGSTKAARLVYLCKSCARCWSMSGRDRQLVEEKSLADTGSRTLRMRALRAPAHDTTPADTAIKLPEGMTITLEATDGPTRGQVYHLDRRLVVIGREEGEVQIGDPMISRRHASLEVHDLDTIILRDLSSTNGTYHNDQLIAFCRLQDGDEIRLGSTILSISVDVLG